VARLEQAAGELAGGQVVAGLPGRSFQARRVGIHRLEHNVAHRVEQTIGDKEISDRLDDFVGDFYLEGAVKVDNSRRLVVCR